MEALLLLLPVASIAFGLLIIWLEDRYYTRHPEKERPETSMWP